MEFSQYSYISTVAFRSTSRSDVTIRCKRWKDVAFQLRFHLAKHFTPAYGVKTADNNFLRSGRGNNIRRGTLPVSGVYLNNFLFIICLTPGPLYAVDMTFKAFQKASNFLLLDLFFNLLSSPGPFTVGLTVSDRTNVQCVFQRKHGSQKDRITRA